MPHPQRSGLGGGASAGSNDCGEELLPALPGAARAADLASSTRTAKKTICEVVLFIFPASDRARSPQIGEPLHSLEAAQKLEWLNMGNASGGAPRIWV